MCHCAKGVPSVTASSCLSHGKLREDGEFSDGFARWEEKRCTVTGRPKGSAGNAKADSGNEEQKWERLRGKGRE